ncbi:MAG: hypothetical protein MUF42_11270 [Cytophagaceae bacterium]|nr:hypothetical protein [Cytophagaceae bacterium]
MKLKSTYLLLVVLILSGLSSCNKNEKVKPAVTGKFLKFFGNGGMNEAESLVETSDGFILVGYSTMLDPQKERNKDIFIVKTDKNGNRQWERRLASDYDEQARHVLLLDDRFLVTGYRKDSTGDSQAIVAQYDLAGNLIGEVLSFGSKNVKEDAYHITALPGNEFLLSGVRDSSGQVNMYLTRINLSEDVIWQRNVGVLTQKDSLSKVLTTSDGNLLWCGTAWRAGNVQDVRCILSTPEAGLIWAYEYGSPNVNESGRDIIISPDGGFVVTGTQGAGANRKIMVMKFGQNGSLQWTKTPASGAGDGYSIRNVSNGGFILTGRKDIGNENTDLLLLRLNADGEPLWEKRFGGTRNDAGKSVLEASDGFFAAAGYADIYDNENHVFYFIKVDTDGNLND